MKARPPSSFCGLSSAAPARSKLARAGPCADLPVWIDTPPGRKPPALASDFPGIRPINSLITLRWNQGGRKVSSATAQRVGNTTKSQLATPDCPDGDVSTVKIDGSGWSKLTVLIAMKRASSYL